MFHTRCLGTSSAVPACLPTHTGGHHEDQGAQADMPTIWVLRVRVLGDSVQVIGAILQVAGSLERQEGEAEN